MAAAGGGGGSILSNVHYLTAIAGMQVVASLFYVAFLMNEGQQFFAAVIMISMAVVAWRYVVDLARQIQGKPSRTWFVGLIFLLSSWILLNIIGALVGATSLWIGPNPAALPLLLTLPFFVMTLYHGVHGVGGGALGPRGTILVVAVIAIPIVYWGGMLMLGGSWANAGGLVGEAGYGIGQAFNAVTEPISDQTSYVFNRVLNPSRNRNLAQLSCAVQLLSGGGVFEVASGSASMAQCVEDTLAGNETTAESEQVTDPLEVQMGDLQLEPFSDHVRVSVPVTNTIVYDLQGVPIRMPARDVEVTVSWQYLDTVVARASQGPTDIPNGDTRQFDFESTGSGPYFATFPIISGDFTDSELENRLGQVRDGEENPQWFISRFENGELSRGRILFLIQTTGELSCSGDNGDLSDICDHLRNHEDFGTPLPAVILQGREYTVTANLTYSYSAEAAFTQSSRWKSGNQLLEVWTEAAWQELPFEERQSWRSSKCGEVEKYGQTFTKQRTAALTTPVVPVMYTDCGISLFRDVRQGEEKDIEITIGANINEESESVDQLIPDQGFRITGAETTCHGGDTPQDILASGSGSGISNSWFTDQEGVGWTSGDQDTTIITRSVTVQGERQSIACRTAMNITLKLRQRSNYEIPRIG